MEVDDVLNLDFEGIAPEDSDVPSMTQLVNQLVKESGVNPELLAKVLVSQNYIGSVLKPCIDDVDFDDGEDPEDQAVYAITSIINLTSRRQEPVIQDLINFVRKSIKEKKAAVEKGGTIFEQVLSENVLESKDASLGLLVKERMINMPVLLVGPSLDNVLSDIETAVKKGMPYKFTHLMYWAKLYLNEGKYTHFDEENSWFDENAIDYMTYPLKRSDTVMVEEDSNSPGAIPVRRIYIIEYSKLNSFLEFVKQLA